MKKYILILSLFLILGISAEAQTAQPTPVPQGPMILVSQGFVDDATKAFNLVVSLRDALEKLQAERGLSSAERSAYEVRITALNDVLKIKDQISDAKDQLIAVYQKINQVLTDMNSKLVAKLNAPKSFFQKVLDTLKEIALITGGIVIGSKL